MFQLTARRMELFNQHLALKKTNGLPRALLPKGVTTSNQVLDSRKSCQVTFPSVAALQGKQSAGNGHYEFTPQNNDDAFLFSERLKCNPSTANVEHKSDYGSVGCHKHNTLHFMAPAKGVMLVGLIEGVPYLKVERYTTQIFMTGNMVLDKRSLPLEIKKVF